jgi:hypothetical protein
MGSLHGLNTQQWKILQKRNILMASECVYLQQHSGKITTMPMLWALEEISELLEETPDRFDNLREFKDIINTLRSNFTMVTHMRIEPIPLAYANMQLILICIVQGLLAYAMVSAAIWPVTFPCLILMAYGQLGLKNLAICLEDPFGVDHIDFDVEKMLQETYTGVVCILSCMKPENKTISINIRGGHIPWISLGRSRRPSFRHKSVMPCVMPRF